MNANNLLRNSLVMIVCMAMAACTSLRRVELGNSQGEGRSVPVASGLRAGDELQVTMKDDTTVPLIVSSVSPAAVEGTDTRTGTAVSLKLVEIAVVERREKDSTKTTLLVIALVIGAIVLIKFITASHILGSA